MECRPTYAREGDGWTCRAPGTIPGTGPTREAAYSNWVKTLNQTPVEATPQGELAS